MVLWMFLYCISSVAQTVSNDPCYLDATPQPEGSAYLGHLNLQEIFSADSLKLKDNSGSMSASIVLPKDHPEVTFFFTSKNGNKRKIKVPAGVTELPLVGQIDKNGYGLEVMAEVFSQNMTRDFELQIKTVRNFPGMKNIHSGKTLKENKAQTAEKESVTYRASLDKNAAPKIPCPPSQAKKPEALETTTTPAAEPKRTKQVLPDQNCADCEATRVTKKATSDAFVWHTPPDSVEIKKAMMALFDAQDKAGDQIATSSNQALKNSRDLALKQNLNIDDLAKAMRFKSKDELLKTIELASDSGGHLPPIGANRKLYGVSFRIDGSDVKRVMRDGDQTIRAAVNKPDEFQLVQLDSNIYILVEYEKRYSNAWKGPRRPYSFERARYSILYLPDVR